MATRPDSNVRAARCSAAESARAVGVVALARMLLRVLPKLLLSLAVLSFTPACIIPVGPDWQDPDGIPDSPPEILSPNPNFGESATATPMSGKIFSFSIFDLNAGDTLYVHWVIDHTQVVDHMEYKSGTGGTPIRHQVMDSIGCQNLSTEQKSFTQHSVVAVVADRGFQDGSDPFALTDPAGQINAISWQLNVTCEVTPSSP
jgi:hypothetical protein